MFLVLFRMALLKASYYGPMGALMASTFPTETRPTGWPWGTTSGYRTAVSRRRRVPG